MSAELSLAPDNLDPLLNSDVDQQVCGFMRRFAGSVVARAVLVGSMAFGIGAAVNTEAYAATSGEAQITYSVTDGGYTHMDAVQSGSDSNYEINGSENNLTSTYAYRNCTDYAWERVEKEFGDATAKSIEGWGDAQNWDNAASNNPAMTVSSQPEAGDLAIWDPYPANSHGHVAFVESVNADGSVNVAEFNKTGYGFYGAFDRRGEIYPGGNGYVDRTNSTVHEVVRADHYIDLNGKNTADFKLKYYAAGTAAPLSQNEQIARDQHEAAVAAAKANKELLAGIPNNGVVRGDNGAWYVRKGDTLQWIVTGDAAAKAIGLDKKRINASKHYSESLIHTQEEGYTYPFTVRDKDYAAGQFGNRVSMTISNAQMTAVAKQLGFDSALINITQGAKGWRFVKAGKQYSVNMDLVAMMATGRNDIFAYPTDWKGPTSWRAYTFKAQTERASYFMLPYSDISLASYMSTNDLPGYRTRLSYLNSAFAGAPCTTPGTVCAWGYGASPIAERVGVPYLPATVSGFSDAKQVVGVDNNGYVLDASGNVWAWGLGNNGGLGNGSLQDSLAEPVRVNIANVKTLTANGGAAYALKADGTVWVWGHDNQARGILGDGKLDTGQIYSAPVQVQGLDGVVSIASSNTDVFVAKSDGTVWGWGMARAGELGNASLYPNGYSSQPVKMAGLSGVKRVAAGTNNGYALKTDGTVMAWGYGFAGGIGNGPSSSNSPTPVLVEGLTGVKDLVVRNGSSSTVYALKTDGTVVAWGDGRHGQLGTGDKTVKTRPTLVQGLSGVAMLGVAQESAYAMKADGTVWAWGDYGAGGIFGSSVTTSILTPTRVAGVAFRAMGGNYAVVK